MDTSKRTKIENELKSLKNKMMKKILELSQNLLDLSEIEQKTQLSKMPVDKKIKEVEKKMKELKENKQKSENVNKQLKSYNVDLDEVVKILYIAQKSADGTATDINNINSAIVDSFRVTLEEQMEREKQLDIKRQKIKKHGWDINNFDGENYWIYHTQIKQILKVV